VRTTDPATGRLISPIVAAALCVKARGLLSDNQAAKVDALKSCWPDFAAMRQLAIRFRGLLRSKHVAKLGVWLKDAHQSGLYATQRVRPHFTRGYRRREKTRSQSVGATVKQKDRSTA
jgi:hypothetical protein